VDFVNRARFLEIRTSLTAYGTARGILVETFVSFRYVRYVLNNEISEFKSSRYRVYDRFVRWIYTTDWDYVFFGGAFRVKPIGSKAWSRSRI